MKNILAKFLKLIVLIVVYIMNNKFFDHIKEQNLQYEKLRDRPQMIEYLYFENCTKVFQCCDDCSC
jgi:hypothetical protein